MNPTYERGPSSDVDVGLNTPTKVSKNIKNRLVKRVVFSMAKLRNISTLNSPAKTVSRTLY